MSGKSLNLRLLQEDNSHRDFTIAVDSQGRPSYFEDSWRDFSPAKVLFRVVEIDNGAKADGLLRVSPQQEISGVRWKELQEKNEYSDFFRAVMNGVDASIAAKGGYGLQGNMILERPHEIVEKMAAVEGEMFNYAPFANNKNAPNKYGMQAIIGIGNALQYEDEHGRALSVPVEVTDRPRVGIRFYDPAFVPVRDTLDLDGYWYPLRVARAPESKQQSSDFSWEPGRVEPHSMQELRAAAEDVVSTLAIAHFAGASRFDARPREAAYRLQDACSQIAMQSGHEQARASLAAIHEVSMELGNSCLDEVGRANFRRLDTALVLHEQYLYDQDALLAKASTLPLPVAERAYQLVGERFKLDASAVKAMIETPLQTLQERFEYQAPHSFMTGVYDFPRHALGTPRVAPNERAMEGYVEVLASLEARSLVLSEPEGDIRKHPTYSRYVELATRSEPPYITVYEGRDAQGARTLVTPNRRRTLAAQDLGKPITAWHGLYNEETELPLKLDDVFQAYLQASAELSHQDSPLQPVEPENDDLAHEGPSI